MTSAAAPLAEHRALGSARQPGRWRISPRPLPCRGAAIAAVCCCSPRSGFRWGQNLAQLAECKQEGAASETHGALPERPQLDHDTGFPLVDQIGRAQHRHWIGAFEVWRPLGQLHLRAHRKGGMATLSGGDGGQCLRCAGFGAGRGGHGRQRAGGMGETPGNAAWLGRPRLSMPDGFARPPGDTPLLSRAALHQDGRRG